MDDCNTSTRSPPLRLRRVQIPLWTIVTSSRFTNPGTSSNVQIPLWTIVTEHRSPREIYRESSDSSMDDCNLCKVLEELKELESSDSSMDDCNQTAGQNEGPGAAFRFLYGRL